MANLNILRDYSDPVQPTQAQLDAAFSSIETFFNVIGIGSDNLQDAAISSVNLQDGAITESRIANSAVTTAKLMDAVLTLSKIDPALLNSLVPIATVYAYAGDTAPFGWALCDGTLVNRNTYASLFAIIGPRFGGGDGVNTFALPDYRGRFLRGVDGQAGRDPDAANRTAMSTLGDTGNVVGSVQDEDVMHTTLSLNEKTGTGSGTYIQGTVNEASGDFMAFSPMNGWLGHETRPQNVSVNYIIKLI